MGATALVALGSGGVAVQGVVLGDGASFAASSGASPSSAKAQKVTVKVEGTTITADVSANGTFELKGIASGTFTLVFLVDGVEIGRVVITAEEGSEVKIVVQVKDSVLVVVEIKVEGADPTATPSPAPARPRASSMAARWARASSSKAMSAPARMPRSRWPSTGVPARPWT